eukprot:GDKJ01062944.1.p1 GENE.GDKJ01062944.1~~GDKJ01062944.1.p1  ORF type:complete len:1015 (-),score=222.58 GDKJ01062944.1:2715-5642(-)
MTQTDKSSSRRYDLGLEWLRLPGTLEMMDVPRVVSAFELGIQQLLDSIDRSVVVDVETGAACNLYEDDYVNAWAWVRADIDRDTAALIKQIRVRAPLLIHSWQLVTSKIREEEMGIMFYDKLFKISPEIKNLFSRPQSQVGLMFAAVVAILIKAVQDPLELANQLRKIAIAHIKFNVQLYHIPIFGTCLVETVQDILQKDFTPEVREAWSMLWERVAMKFYNIIQAGTNLVTKAMITGSAENVLRALEDSPSGSRVAWACKIDLDGGFLSPLYWAIRDGKLAIAQVLLRDVLTIRKDVERMWYGCALLFQAHPDLVEILCNEAPPLLHDLLDGLVWKSRHASNGTRRMVFFVRELWGDPDVAQNQSAYRSPIGSLVRLKDAELFCHPAVDFVLQKKWRLFAAFYFFRSQSIMFLILVSFVLGYAIDYGAAVWCDWLAFICRCICWVLTLVTMSGYLLTAFRQLKKGEVKVILLWQRNGNSGKTNLEVDRDQSMKQPTNNTSLRKRDNSSRELPHSSVSANGGSQRGQSSSSQQGRFSSVLKDAKRREKERKSDKKTDYGLNRLRRLFSCRGKMNCCGRRSEGYSNDDEDETGGSSWRNNPGKKEKKNSEGNINNAGVNLSVEEDENKGNLTMVMPTVFFTRVFIASAVFFICMVCIVPFDQFFTVDTFGKEPLVQENFSDGARVAASIAGIAVFSMLIDLSVAVPSLAAFLHAIVRMSTDLMKFLLVMVVLMLTFATALTICVGHRMENFNSVWKSMFSLTQITLSLEYNTFDGAPDGGVGLWANAVLLVYVIIASVLLLNLLIGQITTSYEFVVQRIEGLAKLDRAGVVVSVEDSMTISNRKHFYNMMNFHRVVALDKHDVGLNGGVAVLTHHQLNSKEVLEDRVIRYSGTINDQQPFHSVADRQSGALKSTSQKIDWIFSFLQRTSRSNRGGAETYLAGGGAGAAGGSKLGGLGGTILNENGSMMDTASALDR